MSDQIEVIVCQRCGRGFILTSTYCDMRERRGAGVVVPVLCPTCFLKKGALPKQCGKVKWFDPRKRYGFIITERNEEIFFHQRQILESNGSELYEGQAVRFHIRDTAKGPEALNVELGEG